MPGWRFSSRPDVIGPAPITPGVGRKRGKSEPYEMFVASPHSLVLATLLGGWEVILILAVLLILLIARRLPEIMRGMGNGMSEFRRELDSQAHDAGKSAGGIFGKPAAEALTPDNQTAELYDPAVLRPGGRKRSVRQRLRDLWRSILKWLRITH